MMRNKLRSGASTDAILLTFVKLVTIALSFVVTRLLSEYLTVYDYGTYSQILLIVSTVTSVTILGMADGVNYFYCSEQNEKKRESHISTIYAIQSIISALAGVLVMVLTKPVCLYFDNPDIRKLLIFAACLPLLQNLLAMTQVLLVSVGKARLLAVRNLVVSLVRLAAVIVVVTVAKNVAVVLATTLVLDVAQVVLFAVILKKNQCPIRFRSVHFQLLRIIFRYCAPMAVFTAVNTLNRDCDKYLIGLMTDTETLALYSNASKVLPFDIVASSFCTVLLPKITRFIADGRRTDALKIYRTFLEITYISTAILCCAVLAASPQAVQLLYSEKYLEAVPIFGVYILVDLLRFTNITLILSAAGKTKKLMLFGIGALGVNALLNVVLYWLAGTIGPAVATLLTTLLMGLCLLSSGARELQHKLSDFFDVRFLLCFTAENAVLTALFFLLQRYLATFGLPYLLILAIICGGYAAVLGLVNRKRFVRALKQVNALS